MVFNLSVLTDATLSMHAKVTNVLKVCCYNIKWVKQVRHSLTRSIAISCKCLNMWRVDACNGIDINITHYLVREFQLVMNDAARVFMGIQRDRNIDSSALLGELTTLATYVPSYLYDSMNGILSIVNAIKWAGSREYFYSLSLQKFKKRNRWSSKVSTIKIIKMNN